MDGGEPGGGGRVAPRDGRREEQGHGQPRARPGRRGGEHDEHPGAGPRPHADQGGVEGAEAPGQAAGEDPVVVLVGEGRAVNSVPDESRGTR